MSIITTWKCDGCGRIARRREDIDHWLSLSIHGNTRNKDPNWNNDEITAFSSMMYMSIQPEPVYAHVCTPECLAKLRESVVEETQKRYGSPQPE